MQRVGPNRSPVRWSIAVPAALTAVGLGAGLASLAGSGGGPLAAASLPVLALSTKMQLGTEIVTHVLAFLIFIWVLKKFAWGPLLKVIDERREKIEGDFQKAEDLQKEADETKAKLEAQLAEIEDRARTEMHKAIEEGKRISLELQAKARAEAEALLARAKQNAEIELANARKALRKDVVELTLAATERVLRETVDRAAQQRHIDKFIDELGGLQ